MLEEMMLLMGGRNTRGQERGTEGKKNFWDTPRQHTTLLPRLCSAINITIKAVLEFSPEYSRKRQSLLDIFSTKGSIIDSDPDHVRFAHPLESWNLQSAHQSHLLASVQSQT